MIPLLITGAVVLFALTGILKHDQMRLHKHGIHALTWRFLTGHPRHGQAITDAGWLRPGQKALTRTGFAPRFHFRPRWQRTVMRTSGTLAFILILYGVAVNMSLTIDFLLAAVGILVILGCWRAWVRWQRRKHRRMWVEPLHAVVAPIVGWPVANAPSSWIRELPEDRSRVTLALPPGRDFSDPKEQDKIVRAVAVKLGIESPEPAWHRHGADPTLTITPLQPPPEWVALVDIEEHLVASGPDELVVGLGRDGKPVSIDLDGDSPHVGLSMGSGGGKSVTSGLILAQMLHKGALPGRQLPRLGEAAPEKMGKDQAGPAS